MNFADVYLESRKLERVDQSSLDELEIWLKNHLPAGYREYMSELGVGEFCGLLRVYPPNLVMKSQEGHRQFIEEYYQLFWENQGHILPFEDALNSILFASTIDGDYIVYVPQAEQKLYVLPRHSGKVFWIDGEFTTPLNWVYNGKPARDFGELLEFPHFASGVNSTVIELFTASSHNLKSLTEKSVAYWSTLETHLIEEESFALIYCRAFDGHIQLTSEGDGRVGIRVEYDKDYSEQVRAFVKILEGSGFYVVRDSTSQSEGN